MPAGSKLRLAGPLPTSARTSPHLITARRIRCDLLEHLRPSVKETDRRAIGWMGASLRDSIRQILRLHAGEHGGASHRVVELFHRVASPVSAFGARRAATRVCPGASSSSLQPGAPVAAALGMAK